MTRLARTYDVSFIEEPEPSLGDGAELRVSTDAGVTMLTPRLPGAAGWGGFNDAANAFIRNLLRERFEERPASGDIVWHYTPMSIEAAPQANGVVVYDAMDELANFRNAPTDLARRERDLLARADLVFTGGPSLYRQRAQRHPRVYCFPSGVDASHFRRRPQVAPPEAETWQAPVIGFYGVLDERIDFGLIANVADQRPAWLFVLIGPLAKISEHDLPRRANIAYIGKRDYSELPAYLSRFDVAMLPFALNDATRFISPTKTLEYLAAGRPVISTPIRDVIELYGEAVEIAVAAQWPETIERLLTVPRGPGTVAELLLAQHGWDHVVARMIELIDARAAIAITPELVESGR